MLNCPTESVQPAGAVIVGVFALMPIVATITSFCTVPVGLLIVRLAAPGRSARMCALPLSAASGPKSVAVFVPVAPIAA